MSRVFMSRVCLKTAWVVMQAILVFAGSARTNAFSKKLAKSAALSIRRRTPIRARATLIDLADFDAPLFNADLKFLQGVSESMQAIKAMVRSHDGLSFATPTASRTSAAD